MAGPAPEWAVRALAGVVHPSSREKNTSIVEMGLLRSVTVCEGHARVELVLVDGWCPFVTRVLADVEDTLCNEPGVHSCHVELVWDARPR
jgi:metal-sulfur cluster biosynthetic enzyme